MKDKIAILRLKSEIDKTLQVCENISSFILEFEKKDIANNNKDIPKAMVICQALSNYYTCIETLFFRISQFFENDLPKEKWHKELLERMTLNIEGIREQVIDENLKNLLLELLKFRHFSRYYFDLNYDWERIDFAISKFKQVKDKFPVAIQSFNQFLDKLTQ
ncbi:MAG: hypothetical protein QXH80_03760 [Candidatus Nanoarchaeia archaeon]